MTGAVAQYRARALQSLDYTVKVDAAGLRPDTTYYYQFIAQGEASPIGRTRTLPYETDHVRLGLASCSNYPFGFFTAYGYMAEFGQVPGKEDLNAIVHVGDYIYEYANGVYGDGEEIGRIPSPNRETIELSDYRWRYGQYRSDPNLQEAHRLHPWIVAWDDHESTNDAYKDGAENHDPSEGDWELRKLASRRAWLEWLPVRDPNNLRLRSGRIFRRFRFGNLAQLDMLDTRIFGREQQVPLLFDFVEQQLLVDPNELFTKFLPELERPDRQLLGARQERWLFEQIAAAEKRHTKWQVLGQQIMMGQLSVAVEPLGGVRLPLNTDQWDGYPAARARLLDTLSAQNVDNTLVLTGDFHSSWCNEISLDPYDGTLYDPVTSVGSQAVEFVCPGITSPFFTDPDPVAQQNLEQTVLFLNPHTKYVDIEKNGYVIVDIDNYRARAEWWHLNDRRVENSGESLAAVFEVEDGTNRALPM
jgi:alkaline phosphatase D